MKRFFGNVIREAIKIAEERMKDALPWGSALFCGGGKKYKIKTDIVKKIFR